MPEVTVHVAHEDVQMGPGDTVDMGSFGIVIWLVEEDAEIWRLRTSKWKRDLLRVRDNIEAQRGAKAEKA